MTTEVELGVAGTLVGGAGRGRKDPPGEPPEGAATPGFWTSGLQNWENQFLMACEPPGLWEFVTAATGHWFWSAESLSL